VGPRLPVAATNAGDRLAVLRLGLAADGVRHAGLRHHVALEAGVDEHAAAEHAAGDTADRRDAAALLHHAACQVEGLVRDHANSGLAEPGVEHAAGHLGLEVKHAVAGAEGRALLGAVGPADAAVKLGGHAADRPGLADVAAGEPAGGHPADVVGGLHHDGRVPHAGRLDCRRQPRGRGAVDDDVGLDVGGRGRSAGHGRREQGGDRERAAADLDAGDHLLESEISSGGMPALISTVRPLVSNRL
jgi:hypothetical protein